MDNKHKIIEIPNWGKITITPEAKVFANRSELVALYWRNHPRFRFLKMCSKDAKLFDIGTGPGGLSFWPEWEMPKRPDIEMHGCDLFPCPNKERYKKFVEMNIDIDNFPYAPSFFDAILSSHVIEHLQDIGGFARKISEVLKPNGFVYLETPTTDSINFPKRDVFLNAGIPTTTTNFYDDETHIKPVSLQQILKIFTKHKFLACESGTIKMPFLEEPLITQAYTERDQECGSYGLWSLLGFAHYVILKKIN